MVQRTAETKRGITIKERDAYMVNQGVRVLRFTNVQVLNDIEAVLSEIAEFLPAGEIK